MRELPRQPRQGDAVPVVIVSVEEALETAFPGASLTRETVFLTDAMRATEDTFQPAESGIPS